MEFTLFFDDPYWVGVIELRDGATLRVLRHLFGAEPGHAEVWAFVLHDLHRLFWRLADVSVVEAAIALPHRRQSPKRAAREARKRMAARGASTAAQAAEKQQIAARQQALRETTKAEHEANAAHKRHVARHKAKARHRGH